MMTPGDAAVEWAERNKTATGCTAPLLRVAAAGSYAAATLAGFGWLLAASTHTILGLIGLGALLTRLSRSGVPDREG